MKSPVFETTSFLYVTPTDSTSMQELLMQEHKQKIYETCSCCGRDTWHIESKQILQPPNYLTIIVNRSTYSNNRITKNKGRMPLDLYIKLGPYKFSLQASVDHHGCSMNSGHYTASINCCGEPFHCNDNKITECNITDTYNSSTAYILLYKLLWNVREAICLERPLSLLALSSVYSLTVEDGSWSTPMVPVWDDILTPTIFWPRGQNIVTIYWPPLRYFDLPYDNQWQSFICLLCLLDRICHLITIILMNF